jgi:hypothetical protein
LTNISFSQAVCCQGLALSYYFHQLTIIAFFISCRNKTIGEEEKSFLGVDLEGRMNLRPGQRYLKGAQV